MSQIEYGNRVKETTTSTGEGTLTLAGAASLCEAFGDGYFPVLIAWDGGYEIAEAEVSESALTRVVSLGYASSLSPGESGFISLPEGTKTVELIVPAHALPRVGKSNGRLALGVGASAEHDNVLCLGAAASLAENSVATEFGEYCKHEIALTLSGTADENGEVTLSVTFPTLPLPCSIDVDGWIYSGVAGAYPLRVQAMMELASTAANNSNCWMAGSFNAAVGGLFNTANEWVFSVEIQAPGDASQEAPPANAEWTGKVIARVIS